VKRDRVVGVFVLVKLFGVIIVKWEGTVLCGLLTEELTAREDGYDIL
jgi:hypothetical protein